MIEQRPPLTAKGHEHRFGARLCFAVAAILLVLSFVMAWAQNWIGLVVSFTVTVMFTMLGTAHEGLAEINRAWPRGVPPVIEQELRILADDREIDGDGGTTPFHPSAVTEEWIRRHPHWRIDGDRVRWEDA